MKPHLITSNSILSFNPLIITLPSSYPSSFFFFLPSKRPSRFLPICSSIPTTKPISTNDRSSTFNSKFANNSTELLHGREPETDFRVQVGNPVVPSFVQPWAKLSLSDQAFFLLSFIACTTSIAFTSLVVAAVPTLFAMGRAATSLSKLADTAREELPSTMAAIRLSSMEISDLTLELSDLSQEITEGVSKSAQAVQAAEAGVRQIGTIAHQRTISMIQERASLPIISLQPVVAGAAKKTSDAVGQATKTLMNMIYRGDLSLENPDDAGIDRVEI